MLSHLYRKNVEEVGYCAYSSDSDLSVDTPEIGGLDNYRIQYNPVRTELWEASVRWQDSSDSESEDETPKKAVLLAESPKIVEEEEEDDEVSVWFVVVLINALHRLIGTKMMRIVLYQVERVQVMVYRKCLLQ